jgi:molybdate transport system substrate-binding protein
MFRTRRRAAAAIALVVIVATSCGSRDEESDDLVVFAASSLSEAFTVLSDAFAGEHPNVHVVLNFAGSADLVSQIIGGAPADIFVSADDANMAKLTTTGGNADEPIVIAKNTFEVIVEPGNPKGISELDDLARRDLIVVLCAETVPCGSGAAEILQRAGISVSPKSFEERVKGVVTKVITGEADAGIVFVTDVLAAGDDAQGVPIPNDVNVTKDYPIVVTRSASNPVDAHAFLDFVASETGQRILADHGFLVP